LSLFRGCGGRRDDFSQIAPRLGGRLSASCRPWTISAPSPSAAHHETFAEHDVEVVAKLYELHCNRPDKHVTVSNELRDQLARTLSEDQRRMAVTKPQQS